MDYKIIIENISKNLKNLRSKRKISQESLINEIGEENLSLRSYKTYESGNYTRVPSLEKISILADYFDVSIDYLIFGKKSVFDDSFNKRDSLKRLAFLIYSLCLRPVKEENPDSDYYGHYYLLSFEKDINNYLDLLETNLKMKNEKFEFKGINDYDGVFSFLKIIDQIDDLNEDWSPSYERLASQLEEAKIDAETYKAQNLQRISKRRNINKHNT